MYHYSLHILLTDLYYTLNSVCAPSFSTTGLVCFDHLSIMENASFEYILRVMLTKTCVCRLWRCTSNKPGTFLTVGIHHLNTIAEVPRCSLNKYLKHFSLHGGVTQFAVDCTDRLHLFAHWSWPHLSKCFAKGAFFWCQSSVGGIQMGVDFVSPLLTS